MNLKQLEAFYWITRLGSFTAAAEQLNMTQSTVSARIHDLEKDLGVDLFDRVHRRVRPTAKGNELMVYAEQAIILMNKIQTRIASPASISGLVRIGVIELIAVTWLPQFIVEIHKRHPNLVIDLEVYPSFELVDKLRQGSLDIILALGSVPGPEFVTESLGAVHFEWMASPSLGVPKKHLRMEELAEWPLITLSRQAYHPPAYEDWFKSNRLAFRRVDTCNRMSTVAALTIAGAGLGYLPPACYRAEIEANELHTVQVDRREWDVPPLEPYVMTRIDAKHFLAQVVGDLAVEISDFARVHNGGNRVSEPLRKV